jgi:hypothetical protein
MNSHGIVLFYIAANPLSTMRRMAEALGLTERRVARIIGDLIEAGLLPRDRDARTPIQSPETPPSDIPRFLTFGSESLRTCSWQRGRGPYRLQTAAERPE